MNYGTCEDCGTVGELGMAGVVCEDCHMDREAEAASGIAGI